MSDDRRPIQYGAEDTVVETPRKGFLPIKANAFDRGFISVVCLIAIHLFWLRFIEAYLHVGFATAISLVLAYFIIRYG